jgi:predicted nucleotidyltransferase component of viral defense system
MIEGKGLLTPLQQDFLRLFASLPDQEHFYLTGGTALSAFYIGHRLSFDLDLFTAEADLVLPLSRQVETVCPGNGFGVRVIRRFATFVEFQLSRADEHLRVDLTQDTPFRFAPALLSRYGVWINDFQDLKVEKLLACYYGRAEPRDALDLYFILRQEAWHPLLEMAAQKDTGFGLY